MRGVGSLCQILLKKVPVCGRGGLDVLLSSSAMNTMVPWQYPCRQTATHLLCNFLSPISRNHDHLLIHEPSAASLLL